MRSTLALALSLFATLPAYAYEPIEHGDCESATFLGPPRVLLHLDEINDLQLTEMIEIVAAMQDIHVEFNKIGATSTEIIDLETTTEPFEFQNWYEDTTPTIHVGFSESISDFERESATAAGITSARVNTNCEYNEAHIVFQSPNLLDWAWGTPSFYNIDYYQATAHAEGTRYFFRGAYLHELLHAFGLGHTSNSYSFLNYGIMPWANREEDEAIRPLPDDVEGIRALYPGNGVRREVALLNTWYDHEDISDTGAAYQKQLCAPAKGDSWQDRFFVLCGTSTSVFPGDFIRTQVAVANYGTNEVSIVHSLYFSTDEFWDPSISLFNKAVSLPKTLATTFYSGFTIVPPGTDKASVTQYNYTLGESSSARKGFTFKVPQLASGNYYVIAHISATTPNGTVVSDWIPLRGQIFVN